jgi:very-short-patch-repair endonuclease
MAVAERLRAKSWTIRTQIGVSKFRIDLGVVHPDKPGEFLAGIECDGAAYHSSASARDWDRVRHIILGRLGWRLLRVWSTDWFIDPSGRLEQLHRDLGALLETVREEDRLAAEAAALAAEEAMEAAEPAAAQESLPEPNVEEALDIEIEMAPAFLSLPDSAPVEPELPPAEPERPLAARMCGTIDQVTSELDLGIMSEPAIALDPNSFHAPGYKPTLQRLARIYVQDEGPITFKRLSDLIARDHGFQRTGGKISSTIWHAVEHAAPRTRSADAH